MIDATDSPSDGAGYYAYRFRKEGDDYDHLCIDEATAGLYCSMESRYDVTIITWGEAHD